ncbi:MAG: HEAT repeat domain-containing protein [Myxococcaceae bacterium]|nr:HEAT repeat domain-containing protein [Myxococcaceae bacterium]
MTWMDSDPAAEVRYRSVAALEPGPQVVTALLEALFDDSWRVRRLAADKLAASSVGDALVGPLLEVLSRRGQTGARNAAATALAHLGPAAVQPLVTLLRHVDPDQRKFAADILGELGRQEASASLVHALHDPDPNVRVSAAEALGKTGGAQARQALEALLGEPDALLQVGALEALTTLEAPPPLPALVPLTANPLTRRSAWRLLGRVRHRSAWVLVVQALRAKATRDAALLALGGVTGPLSAEVEAELSVALAGVEDATAWLAKCLASEDHERRVGALHLVRATRAPELAPRVAEAAEVGALALDVLLALGTPGLVALVEGPSPAILAMSREGRSVACEALVENSSPRFVPALTGLLESGEADLAEVAVRALGRSASVDALPTLLGALDDDALSAAASRALIHLAQTFPGQVKDALRTRAAGALKPHLVRAWASVAGPEALPVLRRALHDEDEAVRAAAAQVAMVAPGEAAGLLGMAVVDESPRVRRGAARAVAGLGPMQGRPMIERLLGDREASVLSCAAGAAMECGAAWASPRLAELTTHADSAVVLAAVQALMVLGSADDAVLERATAHPDGEVVKQVLQEGASSVAVVRRAAALLGDPRWDVRVAAAQALAVSGAREHLAPLEEAAAREAEALVHQALVAAIASLKAR